MDTNHVTEQERIKYQRDLKVIKVMRIFIVCFLGVAALIAAFVFIPNTAKDAKDILTIETPVTAIWETSQRKDLRGHAVEVHGSVTNYGWKPAFNVQYTIAVTSLYENNDADEPLSEPVEVVTYVSKTIPIVWGGQTVSFEHTLQYDEYRDRNLDFDSDVTGKVLP